MSVVGPDRHLPARIGPRLDAQFGKDDGHQAGGDLFAGSHHRIVFARVVHGRRFGAPADQLIGLARHGRNHDSNLVAGIDLALDVPGRLPNAVDIGDGRAAELHHNTRHDFKAQTKTIIEP